MPKVFGPLILVKLEPRAGPTKTTGVKKTANELSIAVVLNNLPPFSIQAMFNKL